MYVHACGLNDADASRMPFGKAKRCSCLTTLMSLLTTTHLKAMGRCSLKWLVRVRFICHIILGHHTRALAPYRGSLLIYTAHPSLRFSVRTISSCHSSFFSFAMLYDTVAQTPSDFVAYTLLCSHRRNMLMEDLYGDTFVTV